MNPKIDQNRDAFLSELRSGNYEKGTIRSDESGRPILDRPDDNGFCARAIMTHMFGDLGSRLSVPVAAKALGISTSQCGYIQREINDTDLSFPEMARRIEREVFKRT